MKLTVRKEVEHIVVAHNKWLREAVETMTDVILLRNLHPLLRSDYAHKFFQYNLITKDEAVEFTKIIGHVTH